ncbi:MAG: RidA family protein [Chloroflexi bacterium]|nr:RidA family protein [Chloroflexota bacterium]MCL5111222.1 RidA family protein [Chloroflexota bacterium]
MPKKEIINPRPPTSGAILSPAVRFGNLVFTSGMVGADAASNLPDSIQEQTRLTLDKIKAALEAAGASMDNVIKVLGFLANIEDRPAFNEVYKDYFPNNPPARSCLEIGSPGKGVLVEVECVACIPS